MKSFSLLLISSFIFFSCSDSFDQEELIAQEETFIDWKNLDLTKEWTAGTSNSIGINSDKLVTGLNNIYQLLDLYSIGIVYKGKLITENYAVGNKESLYRTFSVTKSILSALYGHIIDKKILTNDSLKIDEFFAIEDSTKKSIRINHLLTMTSGVGDDISYVQRSNSISYILDKDLIFDPGTWWQYTSAGTHLLSGIFTKITNQSAGEYAKQYFFPELGITNFIWQKDLSGNSNGGYGLQLRLRDMLKFGHLFLQDGKTANGQILSSNWINVSTNKLVNFSSTFGYGYLWWINISNGQPIYYAVGYGGQYIIIDESRALVIAVTSSAGSSSQYRNQLLDIIFSDLINSFDKVSF